MYDEIVSSTLFSTEEFPVYHITEVSCYQLELAITFTMAQVYLRGVGSFGEQSHRQVILKEGWAFIRPHRVKCFKPC